jgi:hypothetical protein
MYVNNLKSLTYPNLYLQLHPFLLKQPCQISILYKTYKTKIYEKQPKEQNCIVLFNFLENMNITYCKNK